MLFSAYVIALLPLASATFNWGKPVCGTVTSTCYKTTTVPGANPTTVTSTKGDWCYTTIAKTVDKVDCKYTTVTSTKTSTPTVYITGTPTRTVTRTVCAATKTVCASNVRKDTIPEELSNAKRLELGLPLRSPEEEKRFFFHHGPSCTPTTATATATKTVTNNKTTVTSTSCMLTKTSTSYNTKYTTQTSTCYTTVKGPATTITRDCLWPATTTIKTTATYTNRWC